jgi:hypothetical protein
VNYCTRLQRRIEDPCGKGFSDNYDSAARAPLQKASTGSAMERGVQVGSYQPVHIDYYQEFRDEDLETSVQEYSNTIPAYWRLSMDGENLLEKGAILQRDKES